MKKKGSKKKSSARAVEMEDSPLEAFAPERVQCAIDAPSGSLYQGCDGEDFYVWYIRPNKNKTKLLITEVVPGTDKKKTRLRTVKSVTDLTRSTSRLLSAVLDDLREDMVGDLEPEVLIAAKAVPASHTERYNDSIAGSDVEDDEDIEDDGSEDW